MKSIEDKGWMERLLMLFLAERDRETIPGDLLEEKAARAAELGPMRANLWYVAQILSFAPRGVVMASAKSSILSVFCIFTVLAGAWLGSMDFLLKHPGYLDREWIALTIVGQGVLTLIALYSKTRLLKIMAIIGTFSILWLASKAFYGVTHNPHFEGYIVLIAAALVIQSALTWLSMLQHPKQIRKA